MVRTSLRSKRYRHSVSSVKFACASRLAVRRLRWSADPWTRQVH
jgi:hypothetical protein